MTISQGARKRIGVVVLLVVVMLLAVSIAKIVDNHRAFRVAQVTFAPAAQAGDGWHKPGYPGHELRRVDLPFFMDAGRFRIAFDSTKQQLDLRAFAVDCLSEVFLDGRRVMKRAGKCRPCEVWGEGRERRCAAQDLHLDLKHSGRHLLAIETQNIAQPDYDQNRDTKLLFVHHDNDAFGWRVLALSCLAALGWLAISFRSTRDVLTLPVRHLQAVWRQRALLVVLAVSLAVKLIVQPVFMTTDVSESALIYTENLVNKRDLHFAKVDDDYRAAKYFGKSHMHKPPGVYYQYAVPRLLFGFNEAYFPGMARLPGIVGDLLIALVIFSAVRKRRGDDDATLAAAMYALAGGILFTTGVVGRIDSLAVALLMLALRELDSRDSEEAAGNWRFALFFGAAIAWKQLAILALPLLLTSAKRFKWLVGAGLVTFLLCAPYFLDDPTLFLERLTMPQLEKKSGGVSWMINFGSWGLDTTLTPRFVTLAYMLTLCILPLVSRLQVWLVGAITFGLFVVAGKQVYEHYMLWSIPFMLLMAFLERSALSFAAFALGTFTMALNNEHGVFFGGELLPRWSLLVAVVYTAACVELLVKHGGFSDSPLSRWRRRSG